MMGSWSLSPIQPQTIVCCRESFHRSQMQVISIQNKARSNSKNGSMQVCSAIVQPAGQVLAALSIKGFIQPQWLLPVNEECTYTQENCIGRDLKDYLNRDSCRSLYRVILKTSNDFKSGISYPNAGILLAFIGEHGECFVCRLSPLEREDVASNIPSRPRFQRGSKDVITFCGPDLGRLEAVWIAPEAGSWKMEQMSIMVFPPKMIVDTPDHMENGVNFNAYLCKFTDKDILIGDGSSLPAAELRASLLHQFSDRNDLLQVLTTKDSGLQTAMEEIREQGMKEYKILKFSLLSYTAILVTCGTAVSVAAGLNEIAKGFSIGGFVGFFYLFLLQRAVDELPAAPPSSPKPEASTSIVEEFDTELESHGDGSERKRTENSVGEGVHEIQGQGFHLGDNLAGFRSPLTRFSGVMAFAALVLYWAPNVKISPLSKEMLLAGAAGFLMSKIAVVLASNKPF